MNKLNMMTPNMVNENIEKIKQMFPNCVIEHVNGGDCPKTSIVSSF